MIYYVKLYWARSNRKNKIEKNKKLKIYKHKELKPKRHGHEQDTQTHAECQP